MRPGQRCPRCGEFRVGSFNSLCLTCYSRVESATAIAKLPSSGKPPRTPAFRNGTGSSSGRFGVVVRGG